MNKKKDNTKSRLLKFFRDVRRLPQKLKSSSATERKKAQLALGICALCCIILALGIYAATWYVNRDRIIGDSNRYRQMYADGLTNTTVPVASASSAIMPESTAMAIPSLLPEQTIIPMETLAPEQTVMPMGTADANTLVYALETAPPVQSSFAELIMHNADTIGYLEIEDVLSLPVVQRLNDNDYYLAQNFDGEEGNEGALFLDGTNRLVPEDDCLIIYGHNMKNDTMFGCLENYEDMTFLKQNAIVRFDTIYENRTYVPFAAFTASMESGNSHYFDVRQFVFDETSFELFTLKMQTRSIYEIPVDVQYGDRLLLLVTCDYTNTSGRFVLCLRELRADEPEDAMRKMVQQVKTK